MNLRGLRSQLARIEKAKPKPLGTLDWAVWCGLKPIPDMNAEIATGFGITYAGLAELPPPPDPLEMALARLNAEHPDKPPPSPPAVPLVLPPEDAPGAAPANKEVDETARYEPDYPPGYVPEPESSDWSEYDDEPQPGDDDADDC